MVLQGNQLLRVPSAFVPRNVSSQEEVELIRDNLVGSLKQLEEENKHKHSFVLPVESSADLFVELLLDGFVETVYPLLYIVRLL